MQYSGNFFLKGVTFVKIGSLQLHVFNGLGADVFDDENLSSSVPDDGEMQQEVKEAVEKGKVFVADYLKKLFASQKKDHRTGILITRLKYVYVVCLKDLLFLKP